MIQAVLFDLDGTLADTAADLGHALNCMRAARSLPLLPLATTRPYTSLGARGLLNVGFDLAPGHEQYAAMREEFLVHYAQNLCRETCLFAGMPELLDAIESRGLLWGVVTNKAERFAVPLLELLNLGARVGCVIGGDTTGKTKPHPEPLFAASRAMAVAPEHCVYVGDDVRDIEAGRAAGMKVIAVRYGYLNGSNPDTWNADAVIDHPLDVLKVL